MALWSHNYPIVIELGEGGAGMNGRLLMAKIHVQTWGYIFEIVGWFCNTSRLRYLCGAYSAVQFYCQEV